MEHSGTRERLRGFFAVNIAFVRIADINLRSKHGISGRVPAGGVGGR
jgi:hypothetical protein